MVDEKPNTTIEDLLAVIDELRASNEELAKKVDAVVAENKEIRDFNRTLLNRKVDGVKPVNDDEVAKAKLEKYLKGE